ncbi:MAG: membrane-associated protease RseP (regulator of RpoE activity) [Myxococcota bacterium]
MTLFQRGRLRLNALPIGAHVQFAMEDGESDGLRFDTLPAPKKLALLLSGPAALAALSLPLGALHPDLGWLCSALAVANLLPLPGLSGGQSLITFAESARGKPLPGGLLAAWSLGGFLILLGLLGWLFLG